MYYLSTYLELIKASSSLFVCLTPLKGDRTQLSFFQEVVLMPTANIKFEKWKLEH